MHLRLSTDIKVMTTILNTSFYYRFSKETILDITKNAYFYDF
jgi:hypothetical protein